MKSNRTISARSDTFHEKLAHKIQLLKAKHAQELTLEEARRLSHELQIHQIELEMQNEELRRMQTELEESRAAYSDLYDRAPAGYYTFDKNGCILKSNLTGAGLLNAERRSLFKKPFSVFIHTDDQDVFYLHRQDVLASKSKKICEVRLKSKPAAPVHVRLESIPVQDKQGIYNRILTIASNITRQRQDQQVLEESEKKFRILIDTALVGIYKTSIKGDILFANEGVMKIFEYTSMKEMMSEGITARYKNPDDRIELIKRLRKAGKLDGYELAVRTKTGKTKHVLLSATLDHDILSGMVMDITKRREIEDELMRVKEHLHDQVEQRSSELKLSNRDLENANITLKTWLKHREAGKADFQEIVMSNVNKLIIPYIVKLKKNRSGSKDAALLNNIESNLKKIMSPFSIELTSSSLRLTARELQVADLVRSGLMDKDIMGIINISLDTVKAHRKNIRKKLGIYSTRSNLRTTLLELSK